MRVRDHLVVSTVGAALLCPWAGRGVVTTWAASVLIDADHYFWFCLRQRRLSPSAAVRFFNEAEPPQHTATRLLHSPVLLLLVLLLGTRRRGARRLGLGMALHVAIDTYHEARMAKARAAALHRDAYSCQACGAQGSRVGVHLSQQPRLLPSYGTQNLIALCSGCHEAAHSHDAQAMSRYARTFPGVGATEA